MLTKIIYIFLWLLLWGIEERINAAETIGDKAEKAASSGSPQLEEQLGTGEITENVEELYLKNLEQKDKILKTMSSMESAYFVRREKDKKDKMEKQTMKCIVDHCIDITESKLGFIIYLVEEGGEKKCSYSQVTSGELETWLEGYHIRILNKLRYRDSYLIVNDFKEYNELTIAPQNNPPINSFFGLPIFLKNDLLGVICLANREEGYNEDIVIWMEPVITLSSHLLNDLRIEQFRLEADRQRIACEQAKSANEAKTVFLAHMSHEIRTPLMGILGLLDLVNQDNMEDEDADYIEKAKLSGLNLMSLLNNVLDLSKIEAGQIELEKIGVDPIKIAQEIIQLYYPEASKQGTSLTLNISSEVPHHLIGDPMRLRQILSNLISNAIKFTKNGSVSITLTGQEISENNVFYLSGVVTDTGIGIKPEQLSCLFQPFTQADKSIMRQFGGSGLGLYITKVLCKVMGGKIKVTSQFGIGSTFQFTVKMKLPKKQEFPVFNNSPEKSGDLKKFSDLHVLIAEDNRVCRLALKTILDREGCSITVVENGLEAVKAVEAAKKEPYDLILMNGEMPVMGGLEATKEIRKMFNHQTLPIIGITAHDLDQRARFLASGMDGYLTKPVEINRLKIEVLGCLEECKSKTEKLPALHILIAEDNPVNQLVLKTMLNREGCSVTVVENGLKAVKAVEAAKEESYDLILMDGEMPIMDGLEATRRIREMFNHQTLPIIGVTAHALGTYREQFLASGMDGYLTKPVDKNTLKSEILRCLRTER